MKKKYYDGFIVHDILDAHLKPGKMLEVLKAFAEVKGVDAVEVIRCKDCKHRDKETANCTRFRKDWYVQSNSFCSWAEPKVKE